MAIKVMTATNGMLNMHRKLNLLMNSIPGGRVATCPEFTASIFYKMRNCNIYFHVIFIGVIMGLNACESHADYLQSGKVPVRNIDLFNEAVHTDGSVNNLINLTEESAFIQSNFVVTANDIKLIDSSYNRTSGDNFYLYRAIEDSTLKGVKEKKASLIYFTAYQKLAVADKEMYTLYLIKLPDHALIKYKLKVPWQWLKGAPLTAVKKENKIL